MKNKLIIGGIAAFAGIILISSITFIGVYVSNEISRKLAFFIEI